MTTKPLRTGGIAASRDYLDLPAWQKAITLAERAYALTDGFPAREHAGIAAELRAAATRVASHIAAASGKQNEQGILNSYFDAQAAIAELATLAELATRLGYLAQDDATAFSAEREEVGRLVVGLKHGIKVEAKDEKIKAREQSTLDREHAERNERFDRKPKRDFKPRGEGAPDREERQYRKPRDFGDKPRGPRGDGEYKPRAPRGDGEYKPRAPRGDKPYGGTKPYGDKPRGKFGDKKPYGDKKPFGKKPYRKD